MSELLFSKLVLWSILICLVPPFLHVKFFSVQINYTTNIFKHDQEVFTSLPFLFSTKPLFLDLCPSHLMYQPEIGFCFSQISSIKLDYFMAAQQCAGGNYLDAKLINEETSYDNYYYLARALNVERALLSFWVKTGTECIISLLPN